MSIFPTTFSVYDGFILFSFGQQEVVFHFAAGCHNFKWKEALSWSLILVFFPNPPEKNRLWWVASRCLIHHFQFIDVWPSWCSKGCLRDPFLKIETYHTLHLDENCFLDVDRNISVQNFFAVWDSLSFCSIVSVSCCLLNFLVILQYLFLTLLALSVVANVIESRLL